jgi:RimJ/RimL family protein N-acetyltransferase
LFLSKELARIHAIADVRNKASQRVLEKAGLQREGTMRKCLFNRGEPRDCYLYSILRDEWKEPRILTRTEKK